MEPVTPPVRPVFAAFDDSVPADPPVGGANWWFLFSEASKWPASLCGEEK